MEISLQHQGIFSYNFFYGLAILSAVGILVRAGKKRKLETIPWTLIYVTGLIAFIIGCTFITLKPIEWRLVFQNQLIQQHIGASMLGGLLFSVPVILLLRKIYGLGNVMLDAYAYVLPAGMAIQRVGCLIAGCCHGTICELPWSVTYHWNGGSIALHPVQLYECVGCMLSIVLIYYSPRFLKAPGSIFIFSGLSYYLVRFVSEFFRAKQAHLVGGDEIVGLNTIQYVMALLATISIVIIYQLELSSKKYTNTNQLSSVNKFLPVAHFVVIVIISIVCSKWLRAFDVLIIFGLLLIPVAVFIFVSYRDYVMVPQLRMTTILLLILSIVLMSQSSSTNQVEKPKTVDKYNTISFGLSTQQLTLAKQTGTSTSDCGTTPIYTYFKIANTTGAVALARTWVKENNMRYTIGLNTYISGVREEISGASSGTNNFTFIGFNPNFITATKNVEFTIGAYVGDLHRIKTDFNPTNQRSIIGSSKIYPQFGLRLGNPRVFFVNTQFYNSPMGVIPSSPFAIGVGSGFGSTKGNYVELGHSSFSTLYVSSKLALDENVFFTPFFGLGTGLFNHLERNQDGFTFSAKLSARLGQKH